MAEMNGDARDPIARVVDSRRRLAERGPGWTRNDDPGDFATVSLPDRDCDLVRDLLLAERAGTVVEIGLAYGSSALAIAEALLRGGADHPRHVVIDPLQESAYADVGRGLLESAGLDGIVEFVTEPSQRFLPRLVGTGFVADAAFVDGSHLFHNVFVDLAFLRDVVRPGGLVILDDVWWPSVGTAAAYFEHNLGWRPIADAFAGGTVDGSTGRPRMGAFRLPDPPVERGFQEFRPFGDAVSPG